MSDDYSANTQTTGTVAVGGSATGEIETARDRDWFAVTLEEGRTYRFDLKGARTGDGTLSDPYLYGIHDAAGNRISGTTNDDGGASLNSRVEFTATETGTWYVAAGAFESPHYTVTGTYTLSVTEVSVDQAANTGTTGRVSVGGSATGEIDFSGDRDWFAVALEAGRTYRIDLEGTWTGNGASSHRSLVLKGIHDADGVRIDGTSDDSSEWPNSRVTFTPDESGTYYVAAGGRHWLGGAYTVSVTDVTIVDDYAAWTGTSGAVAVGGSVTGEVEYSGDRDWFAVTLEADQTYRIDLEGSRTGSGTMRDPYLYGVHDANGVLIAGTTDDDGGRGRNSRVDFTVEEAGTYYVAAGGLGSDTGTYALSVTEFPPPPPQDDYEAGTETSGAVVAGGSATGAIEYDGDRDWFAVALEADQTYRIELKGAETGAGTLSDPYLYGLHDANGTLIAGTTNNDFGDGRNIVGDDRRDSYVRFTPDETGTYYVAAGANGSLTGTYTVSVAEAPDLAADTGTTGAVAVGGSVSGELEFTGDRDWFKVTLEADRIYRIDLKGAETGAGTVHNPFLAGVHYANGVRIASTMNDNGGEGFDSRVYFQSPGAGTYYVAAGGWAWEGTYTLSVTDVTNDYPEDDYATGTGTTGAVAVGGSTTGEIEIGGDRDWFAVTLEAGVRYRIDLKGAPTGDGTLGDPYLRGVHDANGLLIARTENDDGGSHLNSRVEFTPAVAGTYYVAAGAYRGQSGTYTLSVQDVSAPSPSLDDYAAGTDTTGTVAVGGSATGEIEAPDDRDWFAVTLKADRTYRIDLEGSGAGTGALSDPYLYGIHGADGVLVAGTTDDNGGEGSDSRVEFTATAAGTYYVAAGAAGTGTGAYRLSLTDVTPPDSPLNQVPVTDDFTAGTDTAGSVTAGNPAPAVTGEIEAPDDRDWFAVELEEGRTYRFNLKGSPSGSGTLEDPYLYGLHDANGLLIAGTQNDNGGRGANSRVEFRAAETGTYYVAAGAVEDGEGTYTLAVRDMTGVDDFAAGSYTAGAVTVGGSATGEIDFSGDRDWFAVTLEAGQRYRVDLEGSPTGGGTLSDTYLHGVYDASGQRLAGTENDDVGGLLNSRAEFTAASAGTYYVAAGAYQDLEGTYTVSVEEVL